jgi:hypothetical protein
MRLLVVDYSLQAAEDKTMLVDEQDADFRMRGTGRHVTFSSSQKHSSADFRRSIIFCANQGVPRAAVAAERRRGSDRSDPIFSFGV